MDELTFTWDPHKETANRRRHNVAFREAQSAFYDENARIFADPDHSDDEDRFILLGLSNHPRVLVVCHCYREAESVIRIISARKADKDEEATYWS